MNSIPPFSSNPFEEERDAALRDFELRLDQRERDEALEDSAFVEIVDPQYLDKILFAENAVQKSNYSTQSIEDFGEFGFS